MKKPDKSTIIVAVIGAFTTILVGYWQFVWKPSQEISSLTHTISLTGRVLDNENLSPIANAKVTVYLPQGFSIVYTDSEGVYRIFVDTEEENIEYLIRVNADGYDVYERTGNTFSSGILGDIHLIPHVLSSTTEPTKVVATIPTASHIEPSPTVLSTPAALPIATSVLQTENITIPGNDEDGVTWCASTTGHYVIAYEKGAYSGWALERQNECPPEGCWITTIRVFKNRQVEWYAVGNSELPAKSADYELGYWGPKESIEEAEKWARQRPLVQDSLQSGDCLTFIAVDSRFAYFGNPGEVVITISLVSP